jgi:hypothetical protein
LKLDKRKDRIPKQTKTLVTVEKMLTNEDVKDLLEELSKDALGIESMIAIRQNRDGTITWHITSNMSVAATIYLLERVKVFTLTLDQGEE